jgi:hypothetical protein
VGFGFVSVLIGLRYHFNMRVSVRFHFFTSRCSAAGSNGGCSFSSLFPNCHRPQLPQQRHTTTEPQQFDNHLYGLTSRLPATSYQPPSLLTAVSILSRQVKLCYDRRSVGQCLDVRHPTGANDQILITVGQLEVCQCGTPSMTRRRVCTLQLLLGLVSTVILASESRRTHDYISLSQI